MSAALSCSLIATAATRDITVTVVVALLGWFVWRFARQPWHSDRTIDGMDCSAGQRR
jgi:cytochrome bd-type quinol oxidase subunit 1